MNPQASTTSNQAESQSSAMEARLYQWKSIYQRCLSAVRRIQRRVRRDKDKPASLEPTLNVHRLLLCLFESCYEHQTCLPEFSSVKAIANKAGFDRQKYYGAVRWVELAGISTMVKTPDGWIRHGVNLDPANWAVSFHLTEDEDRELSKLVRSGANPNQSHRSGANPNQSQFELPDIEGRKFEDRILGDIEKAQIERASRLVTSVTARDSKSFIADVTSRDNRDAAQSGPTGSGVTTRDTGCNNIREKKTLSIAELQESYKEILTGSGEWNTRLRQMEQTFGQIWMGRCETDRRDAERSLKWYVAGPPVSQPGRTMNKAFLLFRAGERPPPRTTQATAPVEPPAAPDPPGPAPGSESYEQWRVATLGHPGKESI